MIEEFIRQNKKYCEKNIIGESEKGKPIEIISLIKGKGQRKKALLVSYLHGNEPNSLLTNIRILGNILCYDMLDFWEIISIPIANPDGKELKIRYNAKGIDLNRDFNDKKAKETKAIIRLHEGFKPEIVIDYHSNLSGEDSSIILPSEYDTNLTLCNDIIFSYSMIREQTSLARIPHLFDFKLKREGVLLSKGIYRFDQNIGTLTDYAANGSKMAFTIEDKGTDFGIGFSTELLKRYIKK